MCSVLFNIVKLKLSTEALIRVVLINKYIFLFLYNLLINVSTCPYLLYLMYVGRIQ